MNQKSLKFAFSHPKLPVQRRLQPVLVGGNNPDSPQTSRSLQKSSEFCVLDIACSLHSVSKLEWGGGGAAPKEW